MDKICMNCHWYDVGSGYCLNSGKVTQEDATCKDCLLVTNQMGVTHD